MSYPQSSSDASYASVQGGIQSPAHDDPGGLDQLVWEASCMGDRSALRRHISDGGRTSWVPRGSGGDAGWSCLCVAAEAGHLDTVSQLLETGTVDVDCPGTPEGAPALIAACETGQQAVVELLIEAGADVDKADRRGWTPLHEAARGGFEGVVRLLLEEGAEVDRVTTDSDGWTPLLVAADRGKGHIVQQLLAAGAKVDKDVNSDGLTPLFMAAMNGYTFVCTLLLDAGADLHHTDNEGATPLEIAMRWGQRETALLLLRRGASADDFPPHIYKQLLQWSAEEMNRKDSEVDRLRREMGYAPKSCPGE